MKNTEEAQRARRTAREELPLSGYDDLNVEEVEKKLKDLSKEEIKIVLSYEEQHQNRKTLVEHLKGKVGDGS